MLTEPDFSQVYKPQDLYFFDPTGQVLVPDAVFVPTGTSPAVAGDQPGRGAAERPAAAMAAERGQPHAPRRDRVSPQDHATERGRRRDHRDGESRRGGGERHRRRARADLRAAGLDPDRAAAGLAAHPGGPARDQRQAVDTAQPPCAGAGGQSQSPAQKRLMYSCYNPYPAATSASLLLRRQRAGLVTVRLGVSGDDGPPRPGRPGLQPDQRGRARPALRDPVQASSQAAPPAQPHGVPPLSMVAVSPDGKYAAGVSSGRERRGRVGLGRQQALEYPAHVGRHRDQLGSPGLPLGGPERHHHDGRADQQQQQPRAIANSFDGKIIGLSIAPDGVRVAAIVQTGLGPSSSSPPSTSGAPVLRPAEPAPSPDRPSGRRCRLGPNVPNPIALTWYDADDLLVLDGPSSADRAVGRAGGRAAGHQVAWRPAGRDLHHRQ